MTKVLSLLLRELGEVWPPAGLWGERPGLLLLGVVGLWGERPGLLLLGVVGLWGERPGLLLLGVVGLWGERPGLLVLFGSVAGDPGAVRSSVAVSARSKPRSPDWLKP